MLGLDLEALPVNYNNKINNEIIIGLIIIIVT